MIANLPNTALAARVMQQVPLEQQADIATRIALMAKTSPDVVREVASVMRHNLEAVTHQEYAAAGGVHALAEILNAVDRTTERNILERLGEADSELADEVRSLLFVFEDVLKLDDRAIQLVLKDVESKDLARTCRSASPGEVVDRLMSRACLARGQRCSPRGSRSAAAAAEGRRVAVRRLSRPSAGSRKAGEDLRLARCRCGRRRGRGSRMSAAETYAFPELDGWRVDRPPPRPSRRSRSVGEAERRGHDEGLAAGRALAEAELEPLRAARSSARPQHSVRPARRSSPSPRSALSSCRCSSLRRSSSPPSRSKVLLSVVEGLPPLVDADEVILEVNPADVDAVEAELASLDRSAAGPKVMAVAGERRVGRGGCVVRTRDREIDARLETQLERAGEILRRSLALPGAA